MSSATTPQDQTPAPGPTPSAKPWSLRSRLLRFFLVATAAGWIGSALLVLSVAERENDAQWDDSLHRSGQLLMAIVLHEYIENRGSLDAMKSGLLPDAQDFIMQIFDSAGRLRIRSGAAPVTPLAQLQPGFHDVELPGGRWRVAVLRDEDSGITVMIAESARTRMRDARQLAIALIAPVLIGLPLLALLAQVLSRRALRPLRRAAEQLGHRSATDLQPLESAGLPGEAAPLIDAFNGLMQRLEQLVGEYRQFSSTVAHELRTPLASLKLDVQMLEGSDAQATARALGTLNRMTMVIEQLLVLARLESSRALPVESPFDLRRLIDEVLRQFALRIETKGLRIELDCETVQLHGFENPVYIVLRNLIENAIRHARPQGRVRIAAGVRAQGWWLSVEDDGGGLGDDAAGSLKLGWAIIERIASAMGGRFSKGPSAALGGARLTLEF